jgi:hypothetical protein
MSGKLGWRIHFALSCTPSPTFIQTSSVRQERGRNFASDRIAGRNARMRATPDGCIGGEMDRCRCVSKLDDRRCTGAPVRTVQNVQRFAPDRTSQCFVAHAAAQLSSVADDLQANVTLLRAQGASRPWSTICARRCAWCSSVNVIPARVSWMDAFCGPREKVAQVWATAPIPRAALLRGTSASGIARFTWQWARWTICWLCVSKSMQRRPTRAPGLARNRADREPEFLIRAIPATLPRGPRVTRVLSCGSPNHPKQLGGSSHRHAAS